MAKSLGINGDVSRKKKDTGSGTIQSGNLRIFGDNESISTTAKTSKTEKGNQFAVESLADQNLICKMFEEEVEAKKLMFFFNEKLIDIEKTYPSYYVTRNENPARVCITAPPNRKEHLTKEYEKLQECLESLKQDVVTGCHENDGVVTNALKKMKKNSQVLFVENWKVNTIRFFSKDKQKLDEAVSNFKKAIERETTELTTSQQPSSRQLRRFDNVEHSSAEKYHTTSPPSSRRNRNFDNIQLPPFTVKYKFETKEGLKVKLYKGQITKVNVDGIVNAANETLSNGAGVAYAISQEAGYELDKACREKIRKKNKIKVTKNCVTTAGNLPCDFVIHAVGPQWHDYTTKHEKENCLRDLCTTVINILEKGDKKKMRVIVMPPISSGIFAVPKEMCAAMYVRGIIKYSSDNQHTSVKEFHIIDIQDGMLDLIEDAHKKWLQDNKSIKPEEILRDRRPANKPLSYPYPNTRTRNWKSHDDVGQDGGYNQGTYAQVAASQTHVICSCKEIMKGKFPGRRVYEFDECLQVHVYTGNILEVREVDALVSTENRSFSGTGGLATALLHSGGNRYRQEHYSISVQHKDHPLPLNSVLLTTAGKHKFKNIFHVVIEQFSGSVLPTPYDKQQQETAVKNLLEKIRLIVPKDKNKEIKKIAMSLFGSGKMTTPLYLEIHCGEVYDAIARFVRDHKTSLKIKEIHCVNTKADVTDAFNKVFQTKIEEQTNSGTKQKRAWKKYNRSNSADYESDKYHSSQGYGKSGQQYGKSGFDSKPFKIIDTWTMEKTVPKARIDVFMEMVPGHTTKGFSKSVNVKATGNITIVGSEVESFDKSKSLTIKQTDLKLSKSFSAKDAGKNKGDLKCAAPDCGKGLNKSEMPVYCGQHYYCFVHKPLYEKSCGVCMNKAKDLDTEHSELIGAMADSELKICVICMDDMENPVQLKQCKHQFCRECITEYFKNKPACPVCNTVYGALFGNQPRNGKATVYEDTSSLPGFSRCKTYIIDYEFPDGKQQYDHPHPDEWYKGLHRQAYLPVNKEGTEVLRMLKQAFQQGLIFTIGISRTTGEENVLTWNDIHHKTRREGGPERFGYPDETYISRVIDELEAKGIHCSIERSWNNF